jgi:multicomponent Na+:H+ antiporter subunit G
MKDATTVIGLLCVGLGLFFVAVAAIGVWRLPDLFCRAHALGKAMTMGIIFLLCALGFLVPDASWWKIAVAIIFQLVTIPLSSHLLCLAAYHRGVRRWSAKGFVERADHAPR